MWVNSGEDRELVPLNSIEALFFWPVEANFPLLPEKVSGMCEIGLEPGKYEIGLEGTSTLHEEVVQMPTVPSLPLLPSLSHVFTAS